MNLADNRYSLGLHLWSVLTAASAFPLLLVGGTVTTMRWGMVDDAWPTSPWYLLTHWSEAAARGLAFVAEHGHRQLGWLVGGMTVVLAVWTWFTTKRRSSRRQSVLALACLLGVGLQGLLGGLRVLYEVPAGRELAMMHGIAGQLVFALLAALAISLSPTWLEETRVAVMGRSKLLRLAYLTLGLLIIQLFTGVWLRQVGGRMSWPIVLHLILAAGILFHAVLLCVKAQVLEPRAYAYLRWSTLGLVVLAGLQVLLGLGAWMLGAGDGGIAREIPPERALLATAHMLCGALLLVSSTVAVMRITHHLAEGVAERQTASAVGAFS
ncbi:MAG: COX15/CtaA family protein [Gemmatales bacterium]|nr:COX15/CtaA family protein [Gemmatales bacterium]MDW7994573.1 COX15/CtaA family protein [Gemmatales bacterium]